jgi:hypothetical protein
MLDRYVRDRDTARLTNAMTSLDRDQATLQAPKPAEPVPADVAVRYLRELPKTWAKAKGGQGRAMLATAPIRPDRRAGNARGYGLPQRARGPSWLGGGAAG